MFSPVHVEHRLRLLLVIHKYEMAHVLRLVLHSSGVKAIDHDDGSSYYFDHDNVIVGGWLHKNFLASPGHKRTSKTLGLFSPIGMHNSGPGEQNLETENYESLTNSTILMPEGGTYLMVPACDRNLLQMWQM